MGTGVAVGGTPGVGDAAVDVWDTSTEALHREQYASLVRIAALIVGDMSTAEDVVKPLGIVDGWFAGISCVAPG